MFCYNCGTKVIDGASFCQKCGVKLIRDNRKVQAPVPAPVRESVSAPKSPEEICAVLETEAMMCHGIKAVKSWKNGLSLRGRTHVYFVNIMNKTVKIRLTLSAPFTLIKWVVYWLMGWLYVNSFNMGWNTAEYGSVNFEDYALPFVLAPLIYGLIVAFVPCIGHEEKASVKECIRKVAEPEGITLKTNEMKPVTRFALSAICLLISFLVLLFGVLGA